MANQLHDSVLEFAEGYRKDHPVFTYALRKINTNNRLDEGIWFSGNDKYAFVGLVNRSGGSNKTRSIGLVFRPVKNGVSCYFVVVYNEETDDKVLLFYRKLIKAIGGFEKEKETKYIRQIADENGFEAAKNFMDTHLEKLYKLVHEMKLDFLLFSPNTFEENIERVNSLKAALNDRIDKISAKRKYWLIAPGQKGFKWDEFYSQGIMAIGWRTGDLKQFKTQQEVEAKLESISTENKDHNTNAQQCFEFSQEIKLNDIIIAKKGTSEYLGWGVVTGEYYYMPEKDDFQHAIQVDWKTKGSWPCEIHQIKTVTNITNNPKLKPAIKLLKIETDSSTGELSFIQAETNYPLNTIFYGPPGTGKTYYSIFTAAEIILKRKPENYDEALSVFNFHLHDRVEFITFHQNYSYEDFVQGLRPEIDNRAALTFNKVDGIFKKIADKALENLLLSKKDPEDLSNEAMFEFALEKFKEEIEEVEETTPFYKINDATYIMEVEEDAFRYTGENWVQHANGIRMKFSDLKEYYRNHVKSRKDVKNLNSISGLAMQHATYYFLVYQKILKHLPKKTEIIKKIDRNNYVIVIDEINRANISRVFGELITLIEPDKRYDQPTALKVKLPSGDIFQVPSNLYIIGTMNTADKSIALLDIALRRRFEFKSMFPVYDLEGYKIYDEDVLRKINTEIIRHKSHDFQIGHSYFMEESDLVKRMNNKVIPLLLEYFLNDSKTVTDILGKSGLSIELGSWPLRITGRLD